MQNGLVLAHQDGLPVFVHGGLPGEEVLVQIVKSRAQHSFAVVQKVLKSSADRIDSDCSIFPACGGCSFRHLDYAKEIELKRKLLEENRHLLPVLEDLQIHTAQRNHYRNQVRLHRGSSGRGFYRLHTNEVVPLPSDGCLNLAPEINAKLAGDSILEARLEGDDFNVPLGEGTFWSMPADGFAQSNRFLVLPWLTSMAGIAKKAGSFRSVVELFCGSGLIGGFLKKSIGQLRESYYLGVESHRGALAVARSNFRQFDFRGKFQSLDLYGPGAPESISYAPREDASLLIVNPPRAGLKEALCHWIQKMRFESVIYSSCNPHTLNRDVGILCATDYSLVEGHWFDFFPGTPHSEMVVHLRRNAGP